MRAHTSDEYDWWFRSAYPAVARTVFLILHDHALAEEVAQDAFVQLYRSWPTVRGYERPDLWVRRVAIRMAVRQVKREEMRRERERLAVQEHPDPTLDTDVIRAVATLSPMQRAAVVLYYWADEPVHEIARALEVSESSVKQHLFRARSRLARLLEERVPGDVD